MSKSSNTPGAARAHYETRKANRPVQIWKKALKSKPGVPSTRIAAAKGEVGAIPVKSFSK
jgi:hypothetical protein